MKARNYKRRVAAGLFFAVAVLFGTPAAADYRDALRGEAFTDPTHIQPMSESWMEQPIRYDPEVGRADVVVTLDQHLYQAVSGVIRDYAAAHGLRIFVSEGTCGITAGKLVRKAVDIGGYCCPPGDTDRLPGLIFHTVGVVPIALIVHPDNPIDDITLSEARDIFMGRIYRWSELKDSQGLPGPDLKIQTIGRLHCKIRPGHWRLLLDNEDLFGPRLQEVGTIPDMISLVAASPGAIGYEVMMMVERYRNEGKVKALKIDGLEPDGSNLLSGKYLLYRTLNLTTWKGENVDNPRAVELVKYLLGGMEQLYGKFGIVPASSLRRAGWRFRGDELVGEPR